MLPRSNGWGVGSDGSRKYDESATECRIDWSCGLDPCVAFYANLRAAAVDGGRRDVEKEKRAARRAFHVLFSGIGEHGLGRKLPNFVTAGYHSKLFLLANSKGLVFVLARTLNPRLSDGNTQLFLENPDHHQISPNFFHVALEQREFSRVSEESRFHREHTSKNMTAPR